MDEVYGAGNRDTPIVGTVISTSFLECNKR